MLTGKETHAIDYCIVCGWRSPVHMKSWESIVHCENCGRGNMRFVHFEMHEISQAEDYIEEDISIRTKVLEQPMHNR